MRFIGVELEIPVRKNCKTCKSVEWNFSPGNAVSNEVILHANAKSPRTRPNGFNEIAAQLAQKGLLQFLESKFLFENLFNS